MKPSVLVPLVALLAIAAPLHAGTPVTDPAPVPVTPGATDSDWRFRLAPYGWLTAIDGDIAIGDLSAPLDISMGDTLDSLDMALMGAAEVGYGRWALNVDFVYAKTSQDIGAGGRIFDSFRYEQKQWLITPVLAYRVIETDTYHMDVFAGARMSIMDATLTGRFARGGERSANRDLDWVDPIIGIRGVAEFTDHVFMRYTADIGGFGASSDLMWQAFLGLGYRFNAHWSVTAGYRGLGIDYSDNGFSLDTVTHGPLVGLEVRW